MQEENLIKTIVSGADWQDVLSVVIIEHGMDPLNIDIVKLSEEFIKYIRAMKDFNFRIPARFILVASILLTIKCEKILEEEEKKLSRLEKEELSKLDIDVPLIIPPIKRDPTRKVTLSELISAMSKVLEIRQKKERIIPIEAKSPPMLIEQAEDIEKRMEKIYSEIKNKGYMTFSDLVGVWKRKEIIYVLIPLLSLVNKEIIECEQEELFKEIYIKLK